jgi:hypothetical protein
LEKAKTQCRELQNKLSKNLSHPEPTIPQIQNIGLLLTYALPELTQFHHSESAVLPGEHETSSALK